MSNNGLISTESKLTVKKFLNYRCVDVSMFHVSNVSMCQSVSNFKITDVSMFEMVECVNLSTCQGFKCFEVNLLMLQIF